MAAFSSRGPTQDGRVKPDVVAPGSDVLSLLSSVASKTMPDSEYPNYYRYNLGTSMATPLVAGAAAVLRQALERQGIAAPTASLLRAMLAGGARSLSPGQYGEGTTREVPATRPNNVEGHGHADLGRTLFPDDGRMALYRDRLEVSEIAPLEIEFEVARGGLPLHVVLAWSDPAATPGAGLVLVNDLDLELDTPGGKVKPATVGLGGTDTVNPMERVDVAAAAAGSYTARIKAARLPDDSPGNFTSAIYISGGLDLAPVLYHEPLPPKVNSDGDPLAVAVSTHYHRDWAPRKFLSGTF
jgi:subtilisin family serine protease